VNRLKLPAFLLGGYCSAGGLSAMREGFRRYFSREGAKIAKKNQGVASRPSRLRV